MVAESPGLEEMVSVGEPLCLDILGTQFAVRWGRGVSQGQRESMQLAWARCVSSQKPLAPPLPEEPTEPLPFSASVTYMSKTHDGGIFQLQAASFEELAENLTSRLTIGAIMANAGELIMLHACGIADPVTGAVVALVAKSGMGKTTAASVLASTYGYVTDETVAITRNGSVVPYPKPLSVKQGTGAPKRQVGPDHLGLQQAPVKPFIQSVVLLDRVEGEHPVPPVLQRVPLADALLALIPDSSSQGEIEEPLQSLCRLIDSVGGVWQVTYSEAAGLPAAVEPLFRKHPPSKPKWVAAVPAMVEPDESESGNIPDGCVRRATPKDAVTIDGDLLVMLESEILRLSGIAPAIWRATASAIPLDQLADEVGKVHGTPEGYREAVAAGTARLIAKSVLKQGSE